MMPVLVMLAVLGLTASRRYWGFTAPWDPRSTASLRAHDAAMGAVVSAWIGLDSATALPAPLYPDSAPAGPAPRFAMVTNASGGRFHPEMVRRLGRDSALRAGVADSLGRLLAAGHYRGLMIDFEALTPADTTAYLAVVSAVARAAHARRIAPVSVAVVAGDSVTYPARALLRDVDRVVVMAYDQHWQTAPPGPIASPGWADSIVRRRVAEAHGPARIVVALPVYGYHWPAHQPGIVVGLDDARRLARSWGTTLTRDSASLNLRANGPDSSAVWVTDAVTLDTLEARARRLGVRTFALWRLGLEDPNIWQ
jgi:peptidoglycan-N-acetylglucosamine deacetylase